MANINGYDGFFSATNNHNGSINVWQATMSRVVSDVTGFADTGRRRIAGTWDCQGSASGSPTYEASSTGPGVNTTDWSRTGMAMTLGVVGSTVCYYTVTAVMSQIAFNVNKNGDSGMTFNFENSGGALPAETWDETP